MNSKKYIIRFDDLCPTSNWDMWQRIFALLDEYEIKPVLAVIPDNRDTKMLCSEEKKNFWECIRNYQKKGWMIALHGYNHVYTNHRSGMMGISANSEFVGYSYEVPKKKISDGLDIFKRESVVAEAFIAPSHSFDSTTLKVLRDCEITLISDGHINLPYRYKNMSWLPCQLWEHFNVTKPGVYTVCFHPNFWSEQSFQKFKANIEQNHADILDPHEIKNYKKISILKLLESNYKSVVFKAKRMIKKVVFR